MANSIRARLYCKPYQMQRPCHILLKTHKAPPSLIAELEAALAVALGRCPILGHAVAHFMSMKFWLLELRQTDVQGGRSLAIKLVRGTCCRASSQRPGQLCVQLAL